MCMYVCMYVLYILTLVYNKDSRDAVPEGIGLDVSEVTLKTQDCTHEIFDSKIIFNSHHERNVTVRVANKESRFRKSSLLPLVEC